MDLKEGSIYKGKLHTLPVRYLGMRFDTETNSLNDKINIDILFQFEYILPEHLPAKGQGGIAGYGQTEQQVMLEDYTLVESLDLLYGRTDT